MMHQAVAATQVSYAGVAWRWFGIVKSWLCDTFVIEWALALVLIAPLAIQLRALATPTSPETWQRALDILRMEMNDGLLDLCVVEAMPRGEFMRVMRRMRQGEHLGESGVHYAQTRGVRIACERPVAVIMTHDRNRDRAALELALASHARFIGVVGPRSRTVNLLAALGLSPDQQPRVRTPLGVSGVAESPGEVGLAVVSAIQAVLDRNFRAHLGHDELRPAEVA